MCAMRTTDPLIGQPRGSAATAIAFAEARPNEHIEDIRSYIAMVYDLAPRAGLDPAIVVAQAFHETSDADGGPGVFTSFWWRTRLNPAGIGITGDADEDEASHTWNNGHDAAVSHVAHLYLYAVGDLADSAIAELTPDVDPRYQAFKDAGLRPGFARTIQNLQGTFGASGTYPAGMDKRLAAKWFGKVTAGERT